MHARAHTLTDLQFHMAHILPPPFPFDPLPSSCLTPEHELLMSNELHQDNGAPPINAERQESFHFLSNVCNPINHHQQQQATLFWRRKPTSSQTMKTCQSSSSSKPSKAILLKELNLPSLSELTPRKRKLYEPTYSE